MKAFIFRYYVLIIIIFLIAAQIGCRVIKPVIYDDRVYSGMEIYEKIIDLEPDFSTYSAGRITLNIVENDQKIDIRGSVRIKVDSAIMVSFNAFAGIEAARVLLTQDSVKILDRINNSYFIGDYKEAVKFFPVPLTYEIIQSLFLANPEKLVSKFEQFHSNDAEYRFTDGEIAVLVETDILSTGETGRDILGFKFDHQFLTRNIEFYSSDKSVYGSLKFNSYFKLDDILLPDNISIYFISHNLPLMAELRINRIEVERDIKFPFSVPTRYKPFLN